MLALLAWVAWLRKSTPRVVLHENVVGFDVEILVQVLGDLYDMVVLSVFTNSHPPV